MQKEDITIDTAIAIGEYIDSLEDVEGVEVENVINDLYDMTMDTLCDKIEDNTRVSSLCYIIYDIELFRGQCEDRAKGELSDKAQG
ncbi:MAG: hypothetical protein F4X82_02220 [Candidatus Spechtbacteria bacterium SB0662_bin_43]|uniref:Uncharacterized protein n=1 Tax=Candidatus Spechtbacteria bacterium SB0662_bin_43 TaxID=2604897 RepID=A0A845D9Z7_9BACT|nr:hypothetical protein [Candidatus Spechtbacteria bacterium SB0662_bin_43]